MIERAEAENPAFRAAAIRFLKHAQETINPSVTAADVREMLIQHILTEEIFSHVFDNADFHRQNNVARELYRLEETFFTGAVKHQTLDALRSYYAAIRSTAALVSSHHEKQTFLKVVYENFYKVYNPKAADRLGVVYTPSEIVRFMIESADWLCQRHFGKRLIDKNVEILDPAAGTGTFIAELIEHFRGQPAKLKYKYREELHANEVAILPYYVANLNIEATFAAVANEYEEYPNLCFVDTLDNVGGLRERGRQPDFLGAVSDENVARIKRQNARRISVIIGNPPYNANQLNENENNKNRQYPAMDKRIKETYIAASTAQKTKRYDMYSRFIRWASDRIDENGIVALITNRNFVDGREADGFRKSLAVEFEEIWIVDLGGDWKRRGVGGGGNIFGIGTGVSISFLVKKEKKGKGSRIFYTHPAVVEADEKLAWLGSHNVGDIRFETIDADAEGHWIDMPDTDSSRLLPIASKDTRVAKSPSLEKAVFKGFSLGVSTNRDDWVYGFDDKELLGKIRLLTRIYEEQKIGAGFDVQIKWSETLKRRLEAGQRESIDCTRVRTILYRPYTNRCFYDSALFVDRPGALGKMFPAPDVKNPSIFVAVGQRGQFGVCATDIPVSLDFFVPNAACLFPRRRFAEPAHSVDNITGWSLKQFHEHYEASEGSPPSLTLPHKGGGSKEPITKDAIFHYVYGVLHDPVYREKYALNLKREFPRIPFYADFWRWADWGDRLMALHIGYETVEPWPLARTDVRDEKSRKAELPPKALLRADKIAGVILLDTETQLGGIPKQAWDYRLGNRSALEWVLDQHKEKTPRDPTIREKFNTYRFADHKEKVIELLKRVTRVSVETTEIVSEMRSARDAR